MGDKEKHSKMGWPEATYLTAGWIAVALIVGYIAGCVSDQARYRAEVCRDASFCVD